MLSYYLCAFRYLQRISTTHGNFIGFFLLLYWSIGLLVTWNYDPDIEMQNQ